MAKTAKGLIEYAKAQLGRPYWYGTFGQAASEDLFKQKKKQHPSYYKWNYTPEVAGQKVHDCAGLVKGYLWCGGPDDPNYEYNEKQDISANMMLDACSTKGTIDTIPEIPGLLVFYDGHMGIYIGGGEVIEARGRKYGVVKTKLSKRAWKNWGYCPFVIYEEEKNVKVELPMLEKGDKNDSVKAMQILLIGYGYEMKSESGKIYGADGSFGGATERTLKKYQSDMGLAASGKCDEATWKILLGAS